VLRDVNWLLMMQSQMPKVDPSQDFAERIAEKEAEAKRLNDSLSALTDAFGESPLPAIADQIRSRAERHEAIVQEVELLRQEYARIEHKANLPDMQEQEDKMRAAMASKDDAVRFEARSRIATVLRNALQSVQCHADKTVDVWFPPHNIPQSDRSRGIHPSYMSDPVAIHPIWGELGLPESVCFGIKYNAKLETRMVMKAIRQNKNDEEMDITGFSPSLLLWAMAHDDDEAGLTLISSDEADMLPDDDDEEDIVPVDEDHLPWHSRLKSDSTER
jgi:hypothetical protein